ncbi:MAG: type II toxin-antitoxin system RelE/ParE family toxin [Nitrospiraceae bacterium]|nr:MAG: type II toxin-antitoxin system RelE/ParE family toxin [Nitrospiraceae bacterium]
MPEKHYKLLVPNEVAELIRTLHPHIKKKITSSLRIILSDPHSGKSLKYELTGLKSFRVSKLRIIYRIGKGRMVELVAIGPRERIYEETYRLIKTGR